MEITWLSDPYDENYGNSMHNKKIQTDPNTIFTANNKLLYPSLRERPNKQKMTFHTWSTSPHHKIRQKPWEKQKAGGYVTYYFICKWGWIRHCYYNSVIMASRASHTYQQPVIPVVEFVLFLQPARKLHISAGRDHALAFVFNGDSFCFWTLQQGNGAAAGLQRHQCYNYWYSDLRIF